MTTYIAYDDTHIHGVGSTPAEAEADALSCCRDLTGLKTALCTAALFAQVQTEGGAITWEEIDDGTACTQAEYDLDLAKYNEAFSEAKYNEAFSV